MFGGTGYSEDDILSKFYRDASAWRFLGENNAAQADAMGRKALALATGDAGAQAAGWHLIADSLRALGRNPEAAEADGRAGSLAPR